MLRITTLILCVLLGGLACKESPAPAEGEGAPAAGPKAAKRGITVDGKLQISPEDTCAVCGMMPHKYPKFASGAELEDGSARYFCGTGCAIRAHMHPKTYLGAEAPAIKRLLVPEYFGGELVDALEAHWVFGSDVVGPMGPAFVPLKSEADVQTFTQRHGGKHTFKLGELTPARFQEITGKPSLREGGKMKHGHSNHSGHSGH